MANKKINQLDVRTGAALTDLSLVGDPTSGTSFKLTLQDISTLMGVPGKFNQPTGTTAQYLRGDGSLATLPSLTGFVPYTGATSNVNLGEFGLATGQVTLDTSPTGTAVVGTTRWNDTIGSSETTLKGGSVILKNGVDLVARVVNKVSPNTTLTKANYQAVRVSGAQGQRLAVAFAQANNDANSADTIGLVCETIPTNQEGFIITMGQLENINTTGSLQGETWVDGDVLYLSPTTPGAITKVKPTGNGHIVVIGYVEYAHANNGKIYVKVMNGWELDELHDVDIVSPANNEALIYESSTALWKNKTIATALGYTPISGSGVTGQVAYWNGTNSQTGSNNFLWDNTNNRLTVGGNITSDSSVGFRFVGGDSLSARLGVYNTNKGGVFIGSISGSASIYGYNYTSGSSLSLQLQEFGGNVLIGGTTNGGQRLQVYGDAFVSGAISIADGQWIRQSGMTAGGLRYTGNNIIFYNSANNAIFTIPTGSTSTTVTFEGISATSLSVSRTYNHTSSTSNAVSFTNTFAPTSGTGIFNVGLISTTINQTGGANGITRGLYIQPTLTAAADWRSIEWSNNSGWGLYGAGTSNNYLNGNLWVGSTSATGYKLASVGATLLNGLVVFGTYGTGVGMYWDNANNSFGIGNTSPSAKIDVLGINLVNVKVKSNTNSGATIYQAANDLNNTNEFGMWGSTRGAFGAINSGDGFLYSNVSLAITSGVDIKFGTGATPAERMRLTAAGRLLLGLTAESTFLLDVNGTARVSGNVTISTGTTSQGTFIGASNQARYFSNAGVNTNAIYTSATATDQDVLAAYVSGGAISNLYLYVQSNGYIGTRSGIRLGAASGTDVLTQITNTWLNVAAGTTARSQINLASSTAPTSPNNGDIWFDGTDLKMRIGGVTKTFTLV